MSTAYDEMASGQGALRPHWRGIMATVWGIPPAQLAEKQARAGAHLAHADEFVAIYGRDTKRAPWSIDLLPLILPEAEWKGIAEGLVQRARLLDLVLADLYGEQRLIADHLIPPYLAYANPAFLRPMRHVSSAGGATHLQFYAADLVRMPDGSWRVFADRTQAPSGVGYALRNRRLLARTFPEAFRVYPMRRLQPFLDLWQASLQRIGAHHGDDARAVLLTPGPYNDAYFEHVYLARELSITLAQGSDLTVRDNVVYLKTLDGLLRVDVIYRRVDGEYCDPLELRQDSALGVAGLVDAARAGKVALLNLPGSALVETPAIAPFLPQLARRLLGEELKLPAVTTWWCGQKAALDAVGQSLESFVIRPTFDPDQKPVDPALLSRDDQAALLVRLTANPEAFVALERVVHGVAPTLTKDGLTPRPLVVRVVALWNGADWSVMPGGVARVVEGGDMYRSRLLHGGIAKDVWVLTTEEQDVRTPSAPMTPAKAHRSAGALQSRVADDLFWLGRYVERLDAATRVFRAVLNRLTGGGLGPRDMAELARLAGALRRNGWISAAIAGSPVDGANFAGGVAKAATVPGGVVQDCLDAVRRLAFAVRDRLSLDMWHTLNHLLDEVREHLAAGSGDMDRLLDALDDLIRVIAAFAGLAAENMTRGAGWRFLDIGRRIERGTAIAHTLAPVLRGPPTQIEIGLRLALELCDSTITYRTRYPTELHPARALDLVVADGSNPRALMFQLVRLRDFIATLAPAPGFDAATPLVTDLIRAVVDFSIDSAEGAQETMAINPVLALLDRVAGDLTTLSEMITHCYFSHVQTTHPLGFAPRPVREAAGMTRYAVRHETRYAYGATVDLGLHLLRLTPLAMTGQQLLDYRLAIAPEPSRNVAFRDHFGNAVHHIAIESRHDAFSVTLDAEVDVARGDPAGLADGQGWEQVAEAMRADGFPASPGVAEFAYDSPQAACEPVSTAFAAQSFAPGCGIVAGLRDLTARIRRDFAYVPGSTDISTPVARVMETHRGVCQDFAHLMIAGLRGMGLPARYASGYIRTYPPAGAAGLRGADASHAWVSAWCGEAIGWVDFDPTNDLVVGDEHIVVAYGRDFSDVTPLRGVILGGGAHSLDVAVSVTPLDPAHPA